VSVSRGGPIRRTPPASDAPPQAPGLASRKAATRLLAAVIDARTPLDGLTDNEHGHPLYLALDDRDRALVRAILSTALRFRGTIEALLDARLDRPLPGNATALRNILHVGAAQILFLDVPDSAAVDVAVTQAQEDPRSRRFAGLVNALLRRLSREKASDLQPALDRGLDMPGWFSERLSAAYGADKAARISAAHRSEAPVDFTVCADPAGWAERLGGVVLPTGSVRLERLPGALPDMPGFADGAWWVQDAAAALPARLFGDLSGRTVVDLCAAPGGKTAQLVLAGGQVTAVDASRNRLKRLVANLQRLKIDAETVEADAGAFVPRQLFDAALVDAPCSSTGTIRRHPDVAWTKSPEEIAKLAAVQRRLLEHAFTLVRPGGTVVFSNCSLDPLEGEDMIGGLLADRPDIEPVPLRTDEFPTLSAWITPAGFLRTTPADLDLGSPALSGMDGFFAARLRRGR